jgi:hypothetical protein
MGLILGCGSDGVNRRLRIGAADRMGLILGCGSVLSRCFFAFVMTILTSDLERRGIVAVLLRVDKRCLPLNGRPIIGEPTNGHFLSSQQKKSGRCRVKSRRDCEVNHDSVRCQENLKFGHATCG